VKSTDGAQAMIVPSSVTKRKKDGLPLYMKSAKPVVVLNNAPVGVPLPPPGAGIETTSGTADPSPLYSVETPVPLSATHHGIAGPCTMPQELTRLASVRSARPAMSDTRLC